MEYGLALLNELMINRRASVMFLVQLQAIIIVSLPLNKSFVANDGDILVIRDLEISQELQVG